MAGGFQSTEQPTVTRPITPGNKWLADAVTGDVVGVLNPNANGRDFLPLPVRVSQAQLDSPPQSMLDDVTVTYVLNASPYTRWRSDGAQLIGLDPQDFTYFQFNSAVYDPWTIEEPDIVIITNTAEVRVLAWPA